MLQKHLERLRARLSEFASAPPPESHRAPNSPDSTLRDRLHESTLHDRSAIRSVADCDLPTFLPRCLVRACGTKDRPLKNKNSDSTSRDAFPSVAELSLVTERGALLHDANTTIPRPPPCKPFRRESALTAHHTAWNFLVSAYKYPH